MSKPVVVDLCCGLGGWSRAFLEEGWDAAGFDIERHEYGDKRYPAYLILKSILELNGYDLRHAVNPSLIVASPPCQEFSYMAMPFKRGKQIAAALRGRGEFPKGYTGSRTIEELTALYRCCFRIARECGCPIVVENVKGAQPWVGRAKWHYGSYYLWGDVPALMPHTLKAEKFNPDGTAHGVGSWFAVADSKERGASVKQPGHSGRAWFADPDVAGAFSSKSPARKAASAMIAEIPFDLASHIARVYKP